MKITISGSAGAGKTTVANILAKDLKLKKISAGSIFRKIAKEKGISLHELSKLAEKDDRFDRMVDEYQKKEAEKGNVVVEGRLSGWIVNNADLKVFLIAPLEIRAMRIANRDNKSFYEALNDIKFREMSESKRYREIYGIDINNLEIYDLVLNTSKWKAKEIAEIIKFALKLRKNDGGR